MAEVLLKGDFYESALTDEEKIILTKEDLEREGYVQTKKPWSKAEDKILLTLCKD